MYISLSLSPSLSLSLPLSLSVYPSLPDQIRQTRETGHQPWEVAQIVG